MKVTLAAALFALVIFAVQSLAFATRARLISTITSDSNWCSLCSVPPEKACASSQTCRFIYDNLICNANALYYCGISASTTSKTLTTAPTYTAAVGDDNTASITFTITAGASDISLLEGIPTNTSATFNPTTVAATTPATSTTTIATPSNPTSSTVTNGSSTTKIAASTMAITSSPFNTTLSTNSTVTLFSSTISNINTIAPTYLPSTTARTMLSTISHPPTTSTTTNTATTSRPTTLSPSTTSTTATTTITLRPTTKNITLTSIAPNKSCGTCPPRKGYICSYSWERNCYRKFSSVCEMHQENCYLGKRTFGKVFFWVCTIIPRWKICRT